VERLFGECVTYLRKCLEMMCLEGAQDLESFYIYICMCGCLSLSIYMCVYILCACICMCIYICVCIYIYICVCVCILCVCPKFGLYSGRYATERAASSDAYHIGLHDACQNVFLFSFRFSCFPVGFPVFPLRTPP
jgi:hypothetical protein